MSICVRQPTYVKICSYVAFSQHRCRCKWKTTNEDISELLFSEFNVLVHEGQTADEKKKKMEILRANISLAGARHPRHRKSKKMERGTVDIKTMQGLGQQLLQHDIQAWTIAMCARDALLLLPCSLCLAHGAVLNLTHVASAGCFLCSPAWLAQAPSFMVLQFFLAQLVTRARMAAQASACAAPSLWAVVLP